jgi:hypothetical protein
MNSAARPLWEGNTPIGGGAGSRLPGAPATGKVRGGDPVPVSDEEQNMCHNLPMFFLYMIPTGCAKFGSFVASCGPKIFPTG